MLARFVVQSPERVIKNGCVIVEGDRIIDVGKEELRKKYPRYEEIDARDCIAIPGLLNAHTHAAMTLMRGVADDMPLDDWLGKIWQIEGRLRRRDVYIGTMLACLEMVESGTTCFNDMYFYMDAVADAVEKVGIRGVVSSVFIELGDEERGERELREGEKMIRSCHGKADGRITCALGPHAPYTCSPDFLLKVKERADRYKIPIHIHLAETRDEPEKANKAFKLGLNGKSLVEHLDDIGFLYSNVIAVHCVWLKDKDIAILARRKVGVASNPVSNMKLADGIAPVPEMLKKGVNVGLGTDGAASNNSLDMFEGMKTVALIYKALRDDPTVVAAPEAVGMATVNAANVLHLKDLGALKGGKKADLVLVGLKRAGLTPIHDPISHLVYAARGSDVKTVMVDGKLVVENRKVLTVDEERILDEAQRVSEDLLKRKG